MLDQMVLVGHSMGGLVARLQTLESGEDYWNVLSDIPLAQLDAPDNDKSRPAARTVLSSQPGNQACHYDCFAASRQCFLEQRHAMVGAQADHLARDGRPHPRTTAIWRITTSSATKVSWKSKPALTRCRQPPPSWKSCSSSPSAPWVRYHNIIGIVAEDGVLSKVAGESDGVVTVESARLPGAASELIVEADHINVHRHPRAVLEVQRILLEHLDQTSRIAMQRLPEPSVNSLLESELGS